MYQAAFIDHYDSFSFNLIDWLTRLVPELAIEYVPFDDSQKMRQLERNLKPLIFSPGPRAPHDAPQSLELLEKSLGKVPVFGICLGHQMLGLIAGAEIIPSQTPRHGLCRQITVLSREGFLREAPAAFSVAAYNSLTIKGNAFSQDFTVTAVCENGETQVMEYRPTIGFCALGVQFHPESFLSSEGDFLALSWAREAVRYYSARG